MSVKLHLTHSCPYNVVFNGCTKRLSDREKWGVFFVFWATLLFKILPLGAFLPQQGKLFSYCMGRKAAGFEEKITGWKIIKQVLPIQWSRLQPPMAVFHLTKKLGQIEKHLYVIFHLALKR